MSVSDMVGSLAATPQDAVDEVDGSPVEGSDEVQDRVPAGSHGSNGSNGSARQPVPTGARVPPAFSAKGLDGPSGARQLRYTAPSDDGSVEERNVREDADGTPGSNGAAPSGANRAPKRSSKKARRRGK
jgi:hypothetical protein